MKTTKKTTKKFKPAFVVDLTECYDAEDVRQAFIEAKLNADIALSYNEVMKLLEVKIEDAILDFVDDLFDGHNCVVVNEDGELVALDAIKATIKEPWYKRFWKWLTGRK